MLEKLDNTGELRKVNILESIYFIFSEWELIIPSVIANCFQKAGFSNEEMTEEYYESDIEDDWKTLLTVSGPYWPIGQGDKCPERPLPMKKKIPN